MVTKLRPYRLLFTLCAASALSLLITLAVAAPIPKIVGAKISGGKIYATVKEGSSFKKVEMLNAVKNPDHFLIGEGGDAILYEGPGTAKGGYENENAAVLRYRAEGEYYVLLDEPLNLGRIRQYRSRKGRTAYVISMADGGAGIPYVYVCSKLGKVWEKGAVRVAGARGGKLILKRYINGEEAGDENAKPIGTLYLDLDALLASKN